MSEEHYSETLALEIPGKGHVPICNAIADSYHLRAGMKSPFTGYKVVSRKPESELRRCSDCNTDLLVMPDDTTCPFCGVGYRA